MEEIKKQLQQFIQKERRHPCLIGWKSYHELLSYDSELYEDMAKSGELRITVNDRELVIPLKDITPFFTGARYMTLPWEPAKACFPHFSIQAELLNTVDFSYGSTYRKSFFHNHDFFEIIYVFSGTCTNSFSGQRVTMAEGDICLLNLQEIHQIGIFDDETTVFNLLIRKELFADSSLPFHRRLKQEFQAFFLNSIYQYSDAHCLLLRAADGQMAQHYLQLLIREYFQENPAAPADAYTLLALFLSRFSQELKNSIPSPEKHRSEISAGELLTFIRASFASLSLEELARHYGYSQRSMQRCLNKYFNASFSALIQKCRLEEICRLLVETNLDIQQIAEDVGLGSRSYMDRLFKRTYGMTSLQYRKQSAHSTITDSSAPQTDAHRHCPP